MMEFGSRGLQNVGTNREADKGFNLEIRGLFPPLPVSGNGNISASSNAAVTDIAETMANTSRSVGTNTDRASPTSYAETVANTVSTISTEVDRLHATTQLSSLGDSLSSQADLDLPNLAGETQQVVDDQVGFDDMQPNLAGETQLVGDQEAFDDMVVLQNDMVTVTSVSLANDGFGDPYAPAARSLVSDLPGPIQAAQLHGIEPSLVKEPWRTDEAEPEIQGDTTAEVKLFTSTEIASVTMVTNELPSDKPREGAPIQSECAAVNNDVNEPDVQAIKGRKVSKKFGRKSYQGDVVDYDSENKWFKVVYEDGDEEDLELVEVKEILLAPDSSPMTSSTKKKRPHSEGGDDDEQERNPKKHKEEQIETPKKKGQARRKGKGALSRKEKSRQTKKSSKKPKQVKSPGLKAKSSRKSTTITKPTREAADTKSLEPQKKTDLETKPEEILDESAVKSPVQSRAIRGGKRKRHSRTEASTSSKPWSSKKTGKAKTLAKSSAKKKTGKAKTPRKSSEKKIAGKAETPAKSSENKIAGKAETPAKSSLKKKGTRRRRSLSKLPGEGRKNEKIPSKSRVRGSTVGKDIEEPKSKRLKTDSSREHDVFVGKPIRKDFGGTLYNGMVVKFDEKNKYYKVKYEDGDQEDLELEELEAILVREGNRHR